MGLADRVKRLVVIVNPFFLAVFYGFHICF